MAESAWRTQASEGSAEDVEQNEPDWKKQAKVSDTSFEQQVGALGRETNRSLLESSPMVAGMTGGAALGAPLGPPGIAAGAALGGTAGYLIGKDLPEWVRKIPGMEKFVGPGAEKEPQDVRAWARAGEVVGGSIPFSGAPLAVARTGFRAAEEGMGKFVNRVIDTARQHPMAFATAETSGTAGSALGSYEAETLYPNNAGVRIPAEIAGGFISPPKLITGIATTAIPSTFRTLQAKFGEAGRMSAASAYMRDILEKAGESPKDLIYLLENARIPGVPGTSAMRSGSPALLALERKISEGNRNFGVEQQQIADQGIEALRRLADTMSATGDPELLREAAKVREQQFNAVLGARFSQAEGKALQAAQKLSSDSPRDIAEISQIARDSLGDALKDARSVESSLWGKVDRTIPVSASETADTFDRLVSDLLPGEKLPAVIEGFGSQLIEGNGGATVGELTKFRSRALELVREAAAKGDFGDARRYGQMADAILDDLGTIAAPGTPLDEARTFSRSLHDAFTRTFAGNALARSQTGAERIPPELMLTRAMSGGKTGASLRMGELEQASEFASRLPGAKDTVSDMRKAQERIFRLAAAETVDPATGKVNPDRLAKLARDNEALLDRFPEIQRDMQTAEGNQRLFQKIEKAFAEGRKIADREATFSRVMKYADPSRAIGEAVSSVDPVGRLKAIAKLARNTGGQDALDGMKSAALDHAMNKATGNGTNPINFNQYRVALFNPLGKNQPSLTDLLVSSGAMTKGDAEKLKLITDEAARIEGALKSGISADEIVNAPDALYDLVLRGAGSKVGSLTAFGAEFPLIAQAAGSRMMRQIFEKVPKTSVMKIITEAAKDPKAMATLLARGETPAQKIQIARQMNGFLWNAGLIDLPSTEQQ